MYRILGIVVALSLIALGFLMPQWNTASILTYVGLWLLFGGVFAYLFQPQKCRTILRISAGVLGILMTLSAISFITAQLQTGGTLLQFRSPLVGFFVIGMPAIWFAITGRSRVVDDHEEHTE